MICGVDLVPKSIAGKKITVFLGVTLLISSILEIGIISAGSLNANDGLYVFFLMWSPGLAAIITQLFFERSLKGLGWKPGKAKYLGLAYIIPVGYCLVVYGFTWLSGLGGIPGAQLVKAAVQSFPGTSSDVTIILYIVFMGTAGVAVSLVSALGEEIGWRGLLVPELAKMLPFPLVSLFSGLIWAVWHMPMILFSDYNLPGTPKWYAALMFLILVTGISFVFAWLRLKSGSLWTATVLHASHNIFVQAIFTPLTIQNEITPYVIDEFGCGLALVAVLLAVFFWRESSGKFGNDITPTISG